MNIVDWPDELLLIILNHVYNPWWLEIHEEQAGLPSRKPLTVVSAKPALPSLAPILTCRRFHRLAKDMPLRSFNGVLNIQTQLTPPDFRKRWTFLYPFIKRAWLKDGCNYAILDLPHLDCIEIFNMDWEYHIDRPSIELFYQRPQPLYSMWRKLPGFKRTTRRFLKRYGNMWRSKPLVVLHVAYSESVGILNTVPQLLREGKAVFDLVYEVHSEPGIGYVLLSERQLKGDETRAQLCWTGAPSEMFRADP